MMCQVSIKIIKHSYCTFPRLWKVKQWTLIVAESSVFILQSTVLCNKMSHWLQQNEIKTVPLNEHTLCVCVCFVVVCVSVCAPVDVLYCVHALPGTRLSHLWLCSRSAAKTEKLPSASAYAKKVCLWVCACAHLTHTHKPAGDITGTAAGLRKRTPLFWVEVTLYVISMAATTPGVIP